MMSGLIIPFCGVLCLSAFLFAGNIAHADAIPPNPFESRMERVRGAAPDVGAGPAVASDSEVTPLGLSVAGVVSSGELSLVTFRRDDDGVFSVALGGKIDDVLELVSIEGMYVSVLRLADEAHFKLEIPGAGDE